MPLGFRHPGDALFTEGDAVHSGALARVHRYWRDKRGGRAMPARADLDPVGDLTDVLGDLVLVDVRGAPPEFTYRLVGTRVCEMFGRDVTGQPVGEVLYGEAAEVVRRIYTAVVERRRPVAVRGRPPGAEHKDWLELEALLLPLSADGARVDMILGVERPVRAGDRARGGGDLPRGVATWVIVDPEVRNGA